jgi:hypothetical protein
LREGVLTIIFALSLSATEYVSQIKPYELHQVASNVAGRVEFVDSKLEFTYIDSKKLIIELDTKQDKIELDNLKERFSLAQRMVKIKENQYKSKRDIQRLSEYEKLSEEYLYLKERDNYKALSKNIDSLEETIERKSIKLDEAYLGKIYVNSGNFVNIGTLLFDSYDTSKLSIELFARAEDIENIEKKKIYIDGKVSDFKVEKVSNIKDTTNISTYYVKLIKPNNDKSYLFSKIVTIEFKE